MHSGLKGSKQSSWQSLQHWDERQRTPTIRIRLGSRRFMVGVHYWFIWHFLVYDPFLDLHWTLTIPFDIGIESRSGRWVFVEAGADICLFWASIWELLIHSKWLWKVQLTHTGENKDLSEFFFLRSRLSFPSILDLKLPEGIQCTFSWSLSIISLTIRLQPDKYQNKGKSRLIALLCLWSQMFWKASQLQINGQAS